MSDNVLRGDTATDKIDFKNLFKEKDDGRSVVCPKSLGATEKRLRRDLESFATAPVNEDGKAVFRQAPASRGLPVEDGAPSPLGKSRGRVAAQQSGRGVQNRNIVTGLVRAGGAVREPEPRPGAPASAPSAVAARPCPTTPPRTLTVLFG